MYLLFPGRHHLITSFQHQYLLDLIKNGTQDKKDVFNSNIKNTKNIEGVIFAVTSSNHSGTKRNPIPFYLRSLILQELSNELDIPTYIYGIDDVGEIANFAQYTLKSISHQSDRKLKLTPDNTFVVCSTPVMDMYIKEGFQILPAELSNKDNQTFSEELPWDLLKQISENKNWNEQSGIKDKIHSSTDKIWNLYGLDTKVRTILDDPIIGDDGDITESRDYNSYVRQMDEIAELKYLDTAPYIQSGNVGDIGCAVGSWIKLASADKRLQESDFYGIEVTRQLYDVCMQRIHNKEFSNPSVFFAMKNAVTGLVFEEETMNTIHTSSLTHEIESYGSRADLLAFIKNRYDELKPGGVWINRDVVGPENGDQEVLLWANDEDGSNDNPLKSINDDVALGEYLSNLSTNARFIRFAQDFRKSEGYQLEYSKIEKDGKSYFKLKNKDAADFLLTKDYTDNWNSEMHETFCFWSFNDWKEALEEVGFRLKIESKAYQNPWIAENRWFEKVSIKSLDGERLPFPPSNMLMVVEKI